MFGRLPVSDVLVLTRTSPLACRVQHALSLVYLVEAEPCRIISFSLSSSITLYHSCYGPADERTSRPRTARLGACHDHVGHGGTAPPEHLDEGACGRYSSRSHPPSAGCTRHPQPQTGESSCNRDVSSASQQHPDAPHRLAFRSTDYPQRASSGSASSSVLNTTSPHSRPQPNTPSQTSAPPKPSASSPAQCPSAASGTSASCGPSVAGRSTRAALS